MYVHILFRVQIRSVLFDVNSHVKSNTSSEIVYIYLSSYSHIKTVEENRNAEVGLMLYRKIGYQSQEDFEHYLESNFIRNCTITVNNAKSSVAIFGPNLDSLGGKIVKSNGQHMSTFLPITIPSYIMDNYKVDTLYIDNCYVEGNVFFH